MNELLDFDAFRAEQLAETIPVKVGGVVYLVPASPPASAVLDSVRMQRDGAKKLTNDAVFELAKGILGESWEAIVHTDGLSLPDLVTLIEQVAERQVVAVTVPNRETRRAQKRQNRSTSSSAGRSSKRTSSGNTDSTFAQV